MGYPINVAYFCRPTTVIVIVIVIFILQQREIYTNIISK